VLVPDGAELQRAEREWAVVSGLADLVLSGEPLGDGMDRDPYLVGPEPTPALARSGGLAAAHGLTQIAIAMAVHDSIGAWAHPDADLARERFADLSGRLRVRGDEVEVRLPLGTRFNDLRDAGLLEARPALPWFGRRPLRITGG
jgi:hypothetical protein